MIGDQTSLEQYPSHGFENYWEARDHYMKQQEEPRERARVLHGSECFGLGG